MNPYQNNPLKRTARRIGSLLRNRRSTTTRRQRRANTRKLRRRHITSCRLGPFDPSPPLGGRMTEWKMQRYWADGIPLPDGSRITLDDYVAWRLRAD